MKWDGVDIYFLYDSESIVIYILPTSKSYVMPQGVDHTGCESHSLSRLKPF